MKQENKKRIQWLTRAFEPRTDFYALLNAQANTTLSGMEALQDWFVNGIEERCQKVRDLEGEADELKLVLERKLVDTFITPFDREDIYDLSARLDEVINAAKNTVREIEGLDIRHDDPFLKDMATILVEGTRCLLQSFMNLNGNLQEAANQATLARKSENRFVKIYRQALRQLYEVDDLKQILKTREVYRCMVGAAERIDIVGEKLLHVIVKIS